MKVIIEISREEVRQYCFKYNLPIPANPNSIKKLLLGECAEVRFPWFKSDFISKEQEAAKP